MMARWMHHLLNEALRSLGLARRYWVETLLGLGFVFGIFGGLLFAVLSVSGQSLGSGEADGLIVGFAVWLFAAGAFGSACKEVQEETEQRTLEQLSLAPRPLSFTLAVRTVLGMLVGLGLLALTLLLISLLTDGRVAPLQPQVLGLLLLGAPALVGASYALAGVMLLVKRGELLLVSAQPAVIGLVALPAFPINALALLPYALSAAAARAAATGTPLGSDVWIAVALNSLLYLLAGLAIFVLLNRRARRLGVLGHY